MHQGNDRCYIARYFSDCSANPMHWGFTGLWPDCSDHREGDCHVSIERTGSIIGRRCLQGCCCELLGKVEDGYAGADVTAFHPDHLLWPCSYALLCSIGSVCTSVHARAVLGVWAPALHTGRNHSKVVWP